MVGKLDILFNTREFSRRPKEFTLCYCFSLGLQETGGTIKMRGYG